MITRIVSVWAPALGPAERLSWCQRFGPWVAPDDGEGAWIEASGSCHLFGGEAGLLAAVAAGLGAGGRVAMAGTPGAAWAAARFMADPIVLIPDGAIRQMLGSLPPEALRISPETALALRRFGLRGIAAVAALPRGPLVRRFGAGLARRLDQMFGAAPEPLAFAPPRPSLSVRRRFAQPVGRPEDIEAGLDRLLAVLTPRLEAERLGVRALELRLTDACGTHFSRPLATARPTRDPVHLARLFRDGWREIAVSGGIEAMELRVTAADPLGPRQTAFGEASPDDDLARLYDRLARRNLHPYRPAGWPSWLPERAWIRAGRPGALASGRPRPVVMFARPRPAEVVEEGGAPVRLDGLALTEVEGPERLAAEWWRKPGLDRDYWRVEEVGGRRWWLFRQGEPGRWFRHGVFS